MNDDEDSLDRVLNSQIFGPLFTEQDFNIYRVNESSSFRSMCFQTKELELLLVLYEWCSYALIDRDIKEVFLPIQR